MPSEVPRYATDLTDAQWRILERLLPRVSSTSRGVTQRNHKLEGGMLLTVRTLGSEACHDPLHPEAFGHLCR